MSLQDTNSLGITITDRTCLIMDEVDGMSAGDRGGVGALNALIKKTRVNIQAFVEEPFIRLADTRHDFLRFLSSASLMTDKPKNSNR